MSSVFNAKKSTQMAIISLMVIPISGLAVDIYVPSLPVVGKFFHISETLTQLTVTAFLISYGISQFFTGNFVEAYGRRKVSLIALSFFALFSFMIPFSHGIHELIGLRLLQGLAVGFFIVAKRTIFIDLFSGKQLTAWIAYMTVAWSIGPIIAPGIGGYLQTYFGWQSCFYFLGAYTLLVIILEWFFVPETAREYKKIRPTIILQTYQIILSNKLFLLAVISSGFCYAMVMLFNLLGSFLIQVHMGFSPIQYGHFALIMGFGWTVGGLANRRFLHLDFYRKVQRAVIATVIIALIMVGCGFVAQNIWLIIIPALFMHACAGFIFNNYLAFSLSLFPEHAGSANGIQGSINYILTFAISSALAAILPSNTPIGLAVGYLGLALCCCMIFALITRLPHRALSKPLLNEVSGH